jgi:hypothetical protein
MRAFIDSTPGDDLEGDEIRYKVTNHYIELEFPIGDSLFLVLYYIPRSTSSVFVAACWNHVLDELLDNISDEDEWGTLVETWPTLAQLIVNGTKDRYKEGALIRLEDFDCGETKWFVASVSGNLDLEDLEKLFNDRTQQTSHLVLEKSLDLLTELNENRPSLGRAIVRGIAKGIGAGVIAAIAGAFGIDLTGGLTQ